MPAGLAAAGRLATIIKRIFLDQFVNGGGGLPTIRARMAGSTGSDTTIRARMVKAKPLRARTGSSLYPVLSSLTK